MAKVELSPYCRVCMNYISVEYINLDTPMNDSTYLECFNYCTNLNVVLQDELPKKICISCGESLQTAYDFIKAAKEADHFLRENFNALLGTDNPNDFNELKPLSMESHPKVPNVFGSYQMKHEVEEICFEDVEQTDTRPTFEVIFHDKIPKEHNVVNDLPPNQKDILADDNLKLNKITIENGGVIEDSMDSTDNVTQEDIKLFRCTKCKEAFVKARDLNDHVSEVHNYVNIDPKINLLCRLCGETFLNRATLTRHKINDHKDKDKGLCITCNQSFNDENSLRKHVQEKHSQVECEYCNETFPAMRIKKHIRNKHCDLLLSITNTNNLTCKYCPKVFTSESSLQEHENTHTGLRPYTCEICGKGFHAKKNHTTHMRAIHDNEHELDEPRACTKCDFTTTNRWSWIKHAKRHAKPKINKKRHLCSFCPMTFFSPKHLREHESYAHGDKESAPQCEICKRKFANSVGLKTHMTTHSDERKYKCKECPKTFKFMGTLNAHEKIHKGKDVQCPHCDKKYVTPADLRVHLRKHTGEQPFECHLCDKKFAIRVRLTYHLKKHEGVLYKCTRCPQEFSTIAKLRYHTFQHIGYPYICDHCDMGYERKRGLFRHMKRVHKIVMTEEDLKQNHLKNSSKYYRPQEEPFEVEEEITGV